MSVDKKRTANIGLLQCWQTNKSSSFYPSGHWFGQTEFYLSFVQNFNILFINWASVSAGQAMNASTAASPNVSGNCKMKILLTIILTFFLSQGFSQTYETKMIIAKADSILKIRAGDYLYQFFKYDPKTYYKYGIRKNKLNWKTLNKMPLTKGVFKKSYVRFNFSHPDYPWIQRFTSIRFDSLLNLSEPFDLNFIPDFLKEGKTSNYISEKQALRIAESAVLKDRIKRVEAQLIYNNKTETYNWEILNFLSEHSVDSVYIDPVTGKILKYDYDSYYGTYH